MINASPAEDVQPNEALPEPPPCRPGTLAEKTAPVLLAGPGGHVFSIDHPESTEVTLRDDGVCVGLIDYGPGAIAIDRYSAKRAVDKQRSIGILPISSSR